MITKLGREISHLPTHQERMDARASCENCSFWQPFIDYRRLVEDSDEQDPEERPFTRKQMRDQLAQSIVFHGACRLNPPVVVLSYIDGEHGAVPDLRTEWPNTKSIDWCAKQEPLP